MSKRSTKEQLEAEKAELEAAYAELESEYRTVSKFFQDESNQRGEDLEKVRRELRRANASARELADWMFTWSDRARKAEAALDDAKAEVRRLRRLVQRQHSPYEPVVDEPEPTG